MVAFVVTALVCFITYLLLTIGSANNASFLNLWLWSIEEIIFGLVLSILIGIVARKIFIKKSLRMLNPVRWFKFIRD